jgi:hypothetical protein
MLPRDRGVIVQVGSALAYRGIPLKGAYCAAKHAIQGFTDSLRCELLHERTAVRVAMVQLPALNTPQFGWKKTRARFSPQPVPPIFQPEVGAEAIMWAADHDRGKLYAGASTVAAIIGDKIAPRLGDWYLARTGYAAQQTDEPLDPQRPDNLWGPLVGDHGAHGTFGARSHHRSLQLGLTTRRRALAVAACGVGAVLAAVTSRLRRRAPYSRCGSAGEQSAGA